MHQKPQLLNDNWLMQKLVSVDSTQKYAKRLIETLHTNSSQQIAITASTQTEGYGRLSRSWQSISGNLHLTIIIPVIPYDYIKYSQLSYVMCIAVGQAISSLMDHNTLQTSIKYKWVNDILIDDKKVAGILIEVFRKYFVIGVGVNMKCKPNVGASPGNTNFIGATSITKYISNTDISVFLDILLSKFVSLYNHWITYGFDYFNKVWRANAYKIGKKITFNDGKNVISGIFSDIAEDGALLMQISGNTKKFYAGDFYK